MQDEHHGKGSAAAWPCMLIVVSCQPAIGPEDLQNQKLPQATSSPLVIFRVKRPHQPFPEFTSAGAFNTDLKGWHEQSGRFMREGLGTSSHEKSSSREMSRDPDPKSFRSSQARGDGPRGRELGGRSPPPPQGGLAVQVGSFGAGS